MIQTKDHLADLKERAIDLKDNQGLEFDSICKLMTKPTIN